MEQHVLQFVECRITTNEATERVRKFSWLLKSDWTRIDLFYMQPQRLFCADKLEKCLFLAFEIQSNLMIWSLKPLSVQKLVKNVHLGVENSVLYNQMRSQPQFHAASEKSLLYDVSV